MHCKNVKSHFSIFRCHSHKNKKCNFYSNKLCKPNHPKEVPDYFFWGGCVAWLQDCTAFRCHWNEWHLNTLMFNFNSTFWNCGQNHGTSKRRCVNRASGSPVVSEVHPIGALKTCTSFVMNPQASIWAEMYLPSMPQHDFVCSWTACIRATRGLFFHVVSEKQMKLLQTIAHI